MKNLATQNAKALVGKVFINSRGNHIHLKQEGKHLYGRGEFKFNMCEAETKEEAIAIQQGPWCFSNSIIRLINKGKLKEIQL